MNDVDRAASRVLLAGAIASFGVAIVVAIPHLVFPGTLAFAMVGPSLPWLGVIGFTLFVAYEVHAWLSKRAARSVKTHDRLANERLSESSRGADHGTR